jgi:hypothetical protein
VGYDDRLSSSLSTDPAVACVRADRDDPDEVLDAFLDAVDSRVGSPLALSTLPFA